MVDASLSIGIEAKASNTAGSYVCNDLMYKLVNASQKNNFKAGFIHIPSLENLRGKESVMTLNDLKSGVMEMLKVL